MRGSARGAVAQRVRDMEVIPGALLAYLNDVDPKLPKLMGHLRELRGGLHATRIRPQLGSERIRHVAEVAASTNGAGTLGRLAMVLGGPKQIGVRVAEVAGQRPAGAQGLEVGAAGKPVVDDSARSGGIGDALDRCVVHRRTRWLGRSVTADARRSIRGLARGCHRTRVRGPWSVPGQASTHWRTDNGRRWGAQAAPSAAWGTFIGTGGHAAVGCSLRVVCFRPIVWAYRSDVSTRYIRSGYPAHPTTWWSPVVHHPGPTGL